MQNGNVRRLATKILSSLVALTLVLQPLAASADASDAYSWLNAISGSSSSTSSIPQYPNVSSVTSSKLRVVAPDTATISYTLDAYASNLKINVYQNNSTYPVATLYDAFQNPGTYSANWNVTTGTALGTYKVEVSATNALGVSAVNSTVVFVVPSASKSPSLTNVTVSPAVFSQGQFTMISFATDVSALVTVNVMPVGYTATTAPVYSQDVVMTGASSKSISWYGTDKNGALVSIADYVVLIAAHNDKGSVFAPEKPVRFDGQGYTPPLTLPGVSIFDAAPNPFDSVQQSLTLKFNLDAQATIYVSVKNQSGNPVYTNTMAMSSTQIGYNQFMYGGQVTTAADQGQVAPYAKNGSYTITLTATNSAGTSADSRTFTVINNPGQVIQSVATISGTSFTPNPFSVKNQNATVSYTLSANAMTEFNVYSNGGQVYTTGKVSKGAGYNATTYLGYNQSGSLLTAGTYTYDVRLYDVSTGAFITQSPVASFQVINDVNPQVNKPYFSSVVFTPNPFNVKTQNATVNFNLSSAGSVRLNVLTNAGVQVYSGLQNNMNAGVNTITYQGFNNSNALLPTGGYTYQLLSYAPTGEQIDTAVGSFQAVNDNVVPPTDTTPYFQSVNFTPSTFDVKTTNASIAFSLQNSGYIAFRVEDLNGNILYNMPSLGGITYLPNMIQTLTYTGVNNSGVMLPSGTYKYVITSTATTGSGTDTKSNFFTVINGGVTPPPSYDQITSYNFTPSSFDPRSASATVSFTLVDPVFVVFRAEESNGTIRYEKSTFFSRGYNSFLYDGRDKSGNILDNANYTYKLVVFKSNGVVEAKQGNFTITSQVTPPPTNAPVISGQSATPNPYNPSQGPLRLNYTLSASAYATVTILKDNNIVKTVKVNQLENAGANSAVWDGKFPDSKFTEGTNATAGNYVFRVAAYNSFGSAITTDTPFTVTTATQAACGGFKDVAMTSAYCNAIESMKNLGVFGGYNDGTFRPETQINRAETVKVIMMALKYNVPTSGWWFDSAGFKDVSSSAWYTPYLAAARIYGVINGYADNTFKPANTVNRAEMLKIFLEGANIGKTYVKCDKPYTDNTAGKWYTGYACIAKQYSLVDAVGGQFAAGKAMTRGDVAIMIYRAQILGLLANLPPKKEVVLPQLSGYGTGAFNPSQIPTSTNKTASYPPPSFIPKY